MTGSTLKDRLESLDALIAADAEGPEAGLERIRGLLDPDSFRRRLGFLQQLNRIDEAKALIAMRVPEVEWLEQGVRVATLAGDLELARQLVLVAESLEDTTGTLRLRSASVFVETALQRHFKAIEESSPARYRYAVRPEDRRILEAAVDAMARFRDFILRRRALESRLERDAMTALVLALALIARQHEAGPLVALLAKTRPLNIEVGRFVLDSRLPPVADLGEAFLDHYPDDFSGRLLGLLLLPDAEVNRHELFLKLAALKHRAQTTDDRMTLFTVLSQVAQWAGEQEMNQIDALKEKLLDLSLVEHRRALANHEQRLGHWAAAESLLAEDLSTRHPFTLWLLAQCDFGQQRNEVGVTHLVEAAVTSLNGDWLADAAQRADSADRPDDCIRCLERLREYYPTLLAPRKLLAFKLWNAGRHDEAISELATLIDQLPNDDSIRIHLARAYLQINQPQSALDILQVLEAGDRSDASVPVLLALAVSRLGRPQEAFDSLEKHKTRYWHDKDFLFSYFEAAHAASHEAEAAQALAALNDLRVQGRIDPKQFRLGSLDEVLEYMRYARERREQANAAIIQCRIPWTVCAESFRNPLLWDWMLRTQELRWVTEEVNGRADYSIYATNGFAIDRTEGGGLLKEIEAGETDAVCADYSALITLYELGQLELLFSAYRKVLIPAEYRISILEDTRRLQPHQLSHREAAEAILHFLDLERIHILTSADEPGMAVLNEYSDEPPKANTLRLQVLIDTLAQAGRIDRDTESRLRRLQVRPSGGPDAALRLGDPILIDQLTLRSLFREGMLKSVVTHFRVFVSPADREEFSTEARTYRFQEQARKKLQDLWELVGQKPGVQFVSEREIQQNEESDGPGLALLGFRLAEDRNVPLLADDRALQAVVTNKRGMAKGAAFGTAEFLRSCHERGALSIEAYAAAMERLIRWRYKFLVVPAEVLHHFGSRYTQNAAGHELLLVARYAHDCMGDPGLLGGLENSTPPTSMALKLFITWYAEIGNFLGLVWTDDRFSDERSQALTEWVAQVMLPAVPLSINEQAHGRIARSVREIAISHALLKAGFQTKQARVPALVQHFAELIGVSHRRILQLHAEVVNRVID